MAAGLASSLLPGQLRPLRARRLRRGGDSLHHRPPHRYPSRSFCSVWVLTIDFLRRLFGGGRPDAQRETESLGDVGAAELPVVGNDEEVLEVAHPPAVPSCPSCGRLLDPAPVRTRLCPHCRQRVIVRQIDGRRVLLTEGALVVFKAERQREVDERTWDGDRRRWLVLARHVGAPEGQIARLSAAPSSSTAAEASRKLYVTNASRAVRAARRLRQWEKVAAISREQAAALFAASGSTCPPDDEVVALHREWSVAALRSLVDFGTQVELASMGCCAICARDDGQVFRIAAELRKQRLPHEGCAKGLCGCDWLPLPEAKARKRRVRRHQSRRSAVGVTPEGPEPADGAEPGPERGLATAADSSRVVEGPSPEGLSR